jgi:prepilin-type N-terminal cleavage/methylation domain-containing protein
MRTGYVQSERGFSLIDMIVVAALVGVISSIAIPTITGAVDRMRLGQSTREVEREIQIAKQRAVSKGRAMRIRFNCPAAGQYRMVELIGSTAAPAAADSQTNRCNLSAYPYPASDNDPITRPNLDGPIRNLDSALTFGAAQTIEFWPDGTAHYDAGTAGSWPMIPTAGVAVRVDRGIKRSTISVNGLGRVTLTTQ